MAQTQPLPSVGSLAMNFGHTVTNISAVWELEKHQPVTATAMKESREMGTACTRRHSYFQIQSPR